MPIFTYTVSIISGKSWTFFSAILLILGSLLVPDPLAVRPAEAAACGSPFAVSVSTIAALRNDIAFAVTIANSSTPQPSTITLANGTYALGGTQIEIGSTACTITIDGGANNAPNVILDGGSASRIFQIDSGANVVLNNLTIQHGKIVGGTDANGNGGGVSNTGTLTISSSTLSDNLA